MQEGCEDGGDDGGDWQVKGGCKKGKGRASAPADSAAMPSATVSDTPFPVGPLATTPRPRGAASTTRHQPPVQSRGSGTPMTATESGTMRSLSEQAVQDATATGTSAAAPTSATPQQMATQSHSAAQDEPETPCLDSLPSTPRAPDRNPDLDEETPNPFATVCTSASDPHQERAVLTSASSAVDAAQTTSGSVPMELDIAIGREQNTLGPVTMPAPAAQPAAAGETAQHSSGSAPQPGDGGPNQ